MAKQLVGQAKFQVPGGQATPAPPVGTSLGKYGINLGQFVQQFNDRTKEYGGTPIPVVVSVYNDRTFDFITKSPPAAALLKKAAGIAKGSGVPNKEKVAHGHSRADRRDLQAEDGRPERPRPGTCPRDDRRHGPQHGDHRDRLTASSPAPVRDRRLQPDRSPRPRGPADESESDNLAMLRITRW